MPTLDLRLNRSCASTLPGFSACSPLEPPQPQRLRTHRNGRRRRARGRFARNLVVLGLTLLILPVLILAF
jgi:hypothetical protein